MNAHVIKTDFPKSTISEMLLKLLFTVLTIYTIVVLGIKTMVTLNGLFLFLMTVTYLYYDFVMKSTITELLYRGYKRIHMIVRWLPFLWRHYDFDHSYAIEAFSIQLKHIADFLDSDRAYAMDAKFNAARIRTVLKLLKKVNDEDYAMEYLSDIEKIYGKRKWVIENNRLENKFEKQYTKEELKAIEKHSKQLYQVSKLRQEKARRILVKLIDENIEKWWD